eukprot:TRINITY_DN15249_c0_g1_i1.p2 TRINITY_DN15249_c0_g1~~TRINITY_DN15249_c0_g1_i1.p2  ORF type:complete len:187 (-),score=46.58 TRINITY_DN15249_c0_g1_i1:51-611(-)
MLVLCVFALILCATAQTPPTLSDDFSANVKLDWVNGHSERHIEGKWFWDFTGKRDRFDAEIEGRGRVDAWKVWSNDSKTVTDYIYENGSQKCESNTHQEPLFGVFDFLPHSKAAGTCDGKGNKWSFSVKDAFEFDACISTDGTTPYWVELKQHVESGRHIVVVFHTYKAGRPEDAQFKLPSACTHH